MPNRRSGILANQRREFQIQAHLTEFEKLRDEISQFENIEQQTMVLALGSASVVIPVLIGQVKNMSEDVFASLIYALTIIYSVLAIKYAHASFDMGMVGKYINEYLTPELNRLLETESAHKVFLWESFIRGERKNLLVAYLESAAASATLLLMLFPGAVSLLIIGFISRMPNSQFLQQSTMANPFWVRSVAVIAWITFIASVISVIFATIYNTTKSHSISS